MSQSYNNFDINISKEAHQRPDNDSSISIDSLQLRIPLKETTIINHSAFSNRIVIDGLTGEMIDEFKPKAYKIDYDGIKSYYGIADKTTTNRKVNTFLIILVNSKLLKSRYLEGITIENIRLVYDEIISHKVVSFSFESFTKGFCTDVDFKMDVQCQDFTSSINTMKSYSKEKKQRDNGVNVFNDKNGTNKGIEWNKRATARPAAPYLKIYHKGLELLNNSKTFYSKYVNVSAEYLKNLVRVEATIKNKKHFQKHGIEDTALNNLLSIDNKTKTEIIHSAISINLNFRKITKQLKRDDLKPSEIPIYSAIKSFLDQDIPYNTIESVLLSPSGDKHKRYKARKIVSGIYDKYIKSDKYEAISERQEAFFEAIGWGVDVIDIDKPIPKASISEDFEDTTSSVDELAKSLYSKFSGVELIELIKHLNSKITE